MINLKPCPFCKGYPVCTAYSEGYECYRVICDMCQASGSKYSTAKIAAEAWNKRDCPKSPAQDGIREALAMLRDMIDGGEEMRGHDTEITNIIRVLENGQ